MDLVRHAAGAEDHYVQVFRERFDCSADHFAHAPAAVAGRDREHDHVDRNRNYRKRPVIDFAAHDVERNRQAVVDIELVHHTHVELVGDKTFGNVPSQGGVSFDDGYLARTPTFVSRLEFVGDADTQRRDKVERQRAAVIVVDEDGDIWFVFLDPFTCWFITVEQRLPVSVLGKTLVKSGADGGNVGTTNTCGNFSHLDLRLFAEVFAGLVGNAADFAAILFLVEVALRRASTIHHHRAIVVLALTGHFAGHVLE